MRQRSPRRDVSDLAGLRAGVYLRVSRADAEDKRKATFDEERSTSTQRRIFDEWAERTGVLLADEYADPDMSASRFANRKNRPEFERMVADVKDGKLDVLWFWEISRQQRRLEVFADLRNLCRDKGVLWVFRDRVADPADSKDMLLAGIQSMIAEDESEKLSVRVFDGKESSAHKGKRAGKLPYGYRRGRYDRETNTFGPDEADVFDGDGNAVQDSPAYVVREISDRIYAGESITAIRRDLNDRGIRTRPDRNHPDGCRFDNPQIRYIAMNPAYAGMRVRHIDKGAGLSRRADKIIEGVETAWPPLVDKDKFWAVYTKLADPRRTTTKTDRPGGRLLSAVTRCGVCGGKLTVHKANSRARQRDDVYTCKERTCASVYVSDLEDYVTEVMIRWLSRRETAEQIAAAYGTSAEMRTAQADAERGRAELAQLFADQRAGYVSARAATVEEERLTEVIAEADKRAHDAMLPPILEGLIGEQAEDGVKALTVPQFRQVIAAVADIRIHRVGKHGNRQVPVRDRVEWKWLLGPGAGQDDAGVDERIRAHYAARSAQFAERRAKVAHLRANGWTRQMIAEELGLSISAVAKDIAADRDA